MNIDKKIVAQKLRRWDKYLNEYRLPLWKDIPDFGLYMEQVLQLLTEYLDYMPPELREEQFVTGNIINNYVRKKIMPEPVKKKYYRRHIACLIMICTLKQSLSMTTLKLMIPSDLSEAEFRDFYDAYVRRHELTAKAFVSLVRETAAGILDHQEQGEQSTEEPMDLIIEAAVMSGFSGLLAEKLLLLSGLSAEEIRERERLADMGD